MPFPYPFPIALGEWPVVAVVIDDEILDIAKGSTTVELRIEERGIANFTVVDTAGTQTFTRGQPVNIYDQDDVKIFGGFIDTPGEVLMAPDGGLYHPISCMDNHYLADKRLVIKGYTDQTLGYIVDDIWTDYLIDEGITIGEVQTGPVLVKGVFNYVSVAAAFDALAELTGFTWYIDEDKKLYFIDRTTNAAPWALDSVTYRPLKGSTQLTKGNPFYRNRQYIKGGKGVSAEQTEVFNTDGVVTAFTVGYPMALEPTITDSVLGAQTVGIKGVDTGYNYYWSKGDDTVVADVVPVNGRTVTVVYYGQYPLITLSIHPTDVPIRQAIEGGSGIVEDIVTEAQHETQAAIEASAKGKLDQYCQEGEKFTYKTTEPGLYPGQLQEITFTPFGFAAHEMLIEAVHISTYGEVVEYDITCITGPAVGSWAKFFTHILARQDAMIQIGDSLLLVLLQTSETLELTEATSIDEDEFAVSGIVNRWLNAPPIDAGRLNNVEHERLEMTYTTSETTHLTEDYNWDDADAHWGFATWK